MKRYFFKMFFIIFCLSVTNISPAPRAGIRWYSYFCWLNSATQCLFKLKPLTELLKDKKPEDIKIPDDLKAEKVLREYTKLLQKVIKEKPKILEEEDTDAFYRSVVSFNEIEYGNMQDPHVRVIDHFKDVFISHAFPDDYEKNFSHKENSVSISRCNTCGFSREYDRGGMFLDFINVSFPIFSAQPLKKNWEGRTCKECNEGKDVWEKTRTLRVLPEIVILHQCLGPFEFKIDESVLSPDISKEERSRLKYNLCGFIVWSGSHYWAYTKDYDTGKWYHNDGYSDVFDKEILSDDEESAEEKIREIFEKNRYIKNNFRNGNMFGKPKASVANVLFYAREEDSAVKDDFVQKVSQIKQSLEGLRQELNDLKESLTNISKKLS